MRLLIGLFLVFPLCGCGKAPPVMAGGKPVSHWAETLRAPDPRLRKKAVFKLGNIGATEAMAFPALVKALSDSDARVRCEAILALVKFGAHAKEAIPDLTAVQQADRDAKVRNYAGRALARIRQEE
jgi:HEAT repeat protein